jgi:hypothetical protein
MVQFGIPNCLIFLSGAPVVLLLAKTSVTTITYDSLRDQNLQLVLTISGGSASVVEPTIRTTLPKVVRADTSSVEAPTVRALVVRRGSKASDDNPFDDDPNLLNFAVVVSWIACCTCYLL